MNVRLQEVLDKPALNLRRAKNSILTNLIFPEKSRFTAEADGNLKEYSFSKALRRFTSGKHLIAGLLLSELFSQQRTAASAEMNLTATTPPAVITQETNETLKNLHPPAIPSPSLTAEEDGLDLPPPPPPPASFATRNFSVLASSPEVAEKIALGLEDARDKLCQVWLGKTLNDWEKNVNVEILFETGNPGGSSDFIFMPGKVTGFKMKLQGSVPMMAYTVARHEVMHLIIASHIKQPAPRWADEGAACIEEIDTERRVWSHELKIYFEEKRDLTLKELFSVTEYPPDVRPFYAQSHSLTTFLVAQAGGGTEGRRKFLEFITDLTKTYKSETTNNTDSEEVPTKEGETSEKQAQDKAPPPVATINYEEQDRIIERYFGYPDKESLEESWRAWVDAREPGWSLDPEICKTALEPYRWREAEDSVVKEAYAATR